MDRSWLQGRHLALGVGGGIALYKAADLIRELRRAGAHVRVAMTSAAKEFITPLTLQSLSGESVLTDYFDVKQEERFGHLHLSRWADAFIVAPLTADLLAKLAHGQGGDPVTTSLLAFKGPVLLAPAMNTAMWDHAQTQANLQSLLKEPRYQVVGPGVGPLADGDVGAGRLEELPKIVDAAAELASRGALQGKRVLITAGPTREHFDPVRFLSNPSSGKMGVALAEVARARGARVTLVLGPGGAEPSKSLEVVRITSADQMAEAVISRVEQTDVLIAAAAVSDWKPQSIAPQKVKKGEGPEQVTLVRTPDVLKAASDRAWSLPKRPVLVGFAAETEKLLEHAKEKLKRKRLDFIVANDVSAPGAGFAGDLNEVTVVDDKGSTVELRGDKREVAARIWDLVAPKVLAR